MHQEPFVSGADVIIDRLVIHIPDAHQGFRLTFAGSAFPGYQLKITRQREEFGGNWYLAPEFGLEGWLCPALSQYFPDAPAELFVKADSMR